MAAGDGGDALLLYIVGLPNKEKVAIIQRDLEYSEGKEPGVAVTVSALTAQYGAAVDMSSGVGDIKRSISYTTSGNALPKGQRLSECARKLGWVRGETGIISDCGLTINYRIVRSAKDPNLVSKLHVLITDHDKAVDAIQKIAEGGEGHNIKKSKAF